MSFDGHIPYGPSDEYTALFFDDSGLGDWSFRTSYIITNCGVDDIGTDGLDNIWTSTMEHDWSEDEFNLGGWDTQLRDPAHGGTPDDEQALVNEHAAFPDGRYAIEVTSESHATGDFGTRNLPAIEVCEPESNENIKGIIVDNFIPSIEEVIVYTFDNRPEGGHTNDIYTEIWEVDATTTTRSRDSIPTDYLGACASDGLGIAVRYSEIMNPDELGYFWFTGEWGDEEVYSSQDDRRRWLKPVEVSRRELDFDPTETGFWQLYETLAGCGFPELGYIGRLSLHIGDQTVPLVARDLAGNEMDYDPITIALPRDPETGIYDPSFTESEPYNTGTWGTLKWSWCPHYAVGVYESDELATVDLTELCAELYGWKFLGDCPYYCGFWFYPIFWYVEPPRYEFDVYSYMPDGSYEEIVVPTNYPWRSNEFPCSYHWITSPDYDCCLIAQSGNKIWFSWYDLENFPEYDETKWRSEAWLACYDVESDGFVYFDSETSGWAISGCPNCYCKVAILYPIENDGVHVEVTTWHGYTHTEVEYDVYPDLDAGRTLDEESPICMLSKRATSEYRNSVSTPFPNPAMENVTIPLTLANTGEVEVQVFDITGRVIRTLTREQMNAGNHNLVWNLTDVSGTPVSCGLYYVRVISGDFSGIVDIMVIR